MPARVYTGFVFKCPVVPCRTSMFVPVLGSLPRPPRELSRWIQPEDGSKPSNLQLSPRTQTVATTTTHCFFTTSEIRIFLSNTSTSFTYMYRGPLSSASQVYSSDAKSLFHTSTPARTNRSRRPPPTPNLDSDPPPNTIPLHCRRRPSLLRTSPPRPDTSPRPSFPQPTYTIIAYCSRVRLFLLSSCLRVNDTRI